MQGRATGWVSEIGFALGEKERERMESDVMADFVHCGVSSNLLYSFSPLRILCIPIVLVFSTNSGASSFLRVKMREGIFESV